MLNKQLWTADRGGPPAWGLVEGLTTPLHKKETVTNTLDKPRNWTDYITGCIVWLRNLVSQVERGTQVKGARE